LIDPGRTTAKPGNADSASPVSLSMLVPTNDGFVALESVKAPKRGSLTYYSIPFR